MRLLIKLKNSDGDYSFEIIHFLLVFRAFQKTSLCGRVATLVLSRPKFANFTFQDCAFVLLPILILYHNVLWNINCWQLNRLIQLKNLGIDNWLFFYVELLLFFFQLHQLSQEVSEVFLVVVLITHVQKTAVFKLPCFSNNLAVP